MRVVIIGGGIGGLATAAMLSKQGHAVTLVEKNEQLGGRAGVFVESGFTFDMGPSWYLMPDVFEHFFQLMGTSAEKELDLVRLDPGYAVSFKGIGRRVSITGDIVRDGVVAEQLEKGVTPVLHEYLRRAKVQYDTAIARFLYKNYDSIFDFFTPEIFTDGIKMSVFSTMDRYVRRFFKTTEMQKLMQYPLVFLGSSPYNTPALYSLMSHLDFTQGVYYPMGGISKLIEAIVRLAKSNGADLRVDAPVKRIIVSNSRATGVELESGEVIEADVVISNADPAYTEQHLLPLEGREKSKKYWDSRTLAPSAFIMYLGVKKRLPMLAHHNLVFCEDWKKNFAEIFDDPKIPTDPSFYVCAPSRTDPSVAPEGCENLFVLVPIAPGLVMDDATRERLAEQTFDTMEKELGVGDLRNELVVKRFFSVEEFTSRYNSPKGTALGLAHTLVQTAIFRPNNVSKKVSNLYYVGANTNPGIGMPVCLVSAELVVKRLMNDRSSGPLLHL